MTRNDRLVILILAAVVLLLCVVSFVRPVHACPTPHPTPTPHGHHPHDR